MKVLAAVDRDNVIVQMSMDELYALQDKHVGGVGAVNVVGKTFEIVRAWYGLRKLQDKTAELSAMAGKLRAVADLLQPIACEVKAAPEPDANSEF